MRLSTVRLAAIVCLGLAFSSLAQEPKGNPKFTNKLAKETSPYLLMHAHNPTNWYPWGPEAFEKAKKENKVVFLSIGYSSCYWCHVMERESFNHEEVAKILNESFVCIKVDREERPDIDQIYMTALQSIRSGAGGWPLSMFLMPDGRPIIGGTYWPREDKVIEGEKASGFMTILKAVRDGYKDHKDAFEEQAEKSAAATLLALTNVTGLGKVIVTLDRQMVKDIMEDIKEEFDPEFGGFGNPRRGFKGTKFPTPCRLEFVLSQAKRTGDKELLKMVTLTLDRMAHGGIYDQLGGGFHRYSTERTWTVPHFEKMLYDNAQLVELYALAFEHTKNPLYRRIAEETIAYVQRDMMSPEGALYSSQDAETHHEEGRSYVWTPKELDEALPDKDEAEFARAVFTDKGATNFEGKYIILTLPRSLAETAKDLGMPEAEFLKKFRDVRGKLLAKRNEREQPFLNKIALTSWSGQMIAALAQAGRSLGEPKHIETAKKAAEFVLAHQKSKEGRLLRTYGAAPGQKPKAAVPGYLEDYAFLVHGLLNLYEATRDKRWLDESRALTDVMLKYHGDDKNGGFYFTASDHEKLFARAKDQHDGAQPSGNSMAARNLVRLWKLTGETRYRDEAERTFKTFAASLKSYGGGMTAMAIALDQFVEK
jgi:uncharacterized protein YyaL (SSP411 family)